MKKTLLILAISALTLSLNAYVPMLKKGYEWTYMQWIYSSINAIHTFEYRIDSDTTINGYTYYSFAPTSYGGCDMNRYFFREDTVSERVYILDKSTNKESILYDFSVQAGDSVEIFFRGVDLEKEKNDEELRQAELANMDSAWLNTYKGTPAYDVLFHPLEVVDSSTYAKIYITNVTMVTDLLGNTIRKYEFKMVKNIFAGGGMTGGSYYERYGAVSHSIIDYTSRRMSFENSTTTLRCGIDDKGNVGLHRTSSQEDKIGHDCCLEAYWLAPFVKIPTSVDEVKKDNIPQQTVSPQAEEVKAETLPEENPSNEEETPVEKKPFKSKNLKRCTMGLEKYHSKK